ncbi:protein of unknown function [Carnobacterium alterfunditum]|uniref:Transcobalamin-like C-terminal domain-containing protein n=1 Tax=Carnobacterium alterfunditum TaxID=28230 RepID=A0A1N6HUN3_9LACT|nr:DUF4430 domain-containing protein [Carnobacterium alterfunditum]SIO23446.1 protein of unknown function [Carnobacterium alterfunditum]
MKIFKIGLILVTALSLAACGDMGTQEAVSSESSSLVESQTKEMLSVAISLEQDEEEIEGKTKELEVEAGTTVLDLLSEQYKVVEEDGFIVSIEGIEQDEEAEKYWMYEVNNEEPTVGAAEYEVEDGDQVKWFLNAWK